MRLRALESRLLLSHVLVATVAFLRMVRGSVPPRVPGGLTVFGLASFVAGPIIAALPGDVADVRRRVRSARLVG